MGRYDGIRCPVCGEAFTDKDDIVVCPDCGAPHHRACFETNGRCAYVEKHASGEEWRRPSEKTIDGNAPARCPRCGTLNQPGTPYCEVCGSLLEDLRPQNDSGTAPRPGDSEGTPPVFVMPYTPFTTPLGGLHADETIEDIPVKEIAMFVGPSSYYYLPRFKAMSLTKRRASWNWAAFFGNAVYFCSRRMYALGLLLIAVFLVKIIPGCMLMVEYHQAILAQGLDFFENMPLRAQQLYGLAELLDYAYWAVSVLLGAYANHLYQRHVLDSMKALRQKHADTAQYHAELKKRGGLRMGLAVTLASAALLLLAASNITSLLVLPF